MIGADQFGGGGGAGGEEEAQPPGHRRALFEGLEQALMGRGHGAEIADPLASTACQTRSASKPSWITTPAPQ